MKEREPYNRKIEHKTGALQGCLFGLCMITAVSLSACDSNASGKNTSKNDKKPQKEKEWTEYIAPDIDSYDSEDTAIVLEKNTTDGTVTFWNRNVKRSYTLNYDGTSKFTDKYGQNISVTQLLPGDVVCVRFIKSDKHLTSLMLSPDVWSFEKVVSFTIDADRNEATVGLDGKKLRITDNTKFFSEGKSIDMMEITPADMVSFYGIDTELLTVRVERGHGYLRLTGDEKLIGGWIEIGQTMIRPISEDMLLTLATGSYPVTISKGKTYVEKTIVVNREEETVLDLSDVHIADPEKGSILFSLTPTDAKLYVDGEKRDSSLPVILEYGLHQLIVKADGYQSVTKYLKVGEPSTALDIILDPVNSQDQSDEKGSDYKIFVDAPEGAEVYLDGNYIGIVPCSFRKQAGTRVITLRKNGYATKSCTIQVGEEKKDISYSFADLVQVDSESSDTQSQSSGGQQSSGAQSQSGGGQQSSVEEQKISVQESQSDIGEPPSE